MICYACAKNIEEKEMKDMKVSRDISMYPNDFVVFFHVNGLCEQEIYEIEKEMEDLYERY